jgi:hypothetical protein
VINAEQLLNLGAPEEAPEGTMVGSASAPALLAEGEAPAEEGGGGGVKFTEGTNAEKTPEAQAKSLRHQRKSLGERASAQAKRVQKLAAEAGSARAGRPQQRSGLAREEDVPFYRRSSHYKEGVLLQRKRAPFYRGSRLFRSH